VRRFEMLENRNLGAALVVIGVLANNYIYLHDVIMGTFDGAIVLGWLATIGIVVTLVVTALGLYILMRSHEGSTAE
jgi:hypothetical protein